MLVYIIGSYRLMCLNFDDVPRLSHPVCILNFESSVYACIFLWNSLTEYHSYVVLEYCIGGLQEMLDKAPHNKFPLFQAHK